MKSLIIINGDMINKDILKKEAKKSDVVICADGGAEHAYNADIVPDYLIGDFDSINEKILNYYKERNVVIEKYKAEKDYTDTELCINKAIEIGASHIIVACASGNRTDHTLANIFLIDYINSLDAEAEIITKDAHICCLRDSITIEGKPNDIISIIPYNGDASGLNSTGLKYHMKDLNIKFGKTIGISNVMIRNKATISIKSGKAFVIKEMIK